MSAVIPAGAGFLLDPERSRLSELEAVVERGLGAFVEVGNALMEIRDARLYRDTHSTFESYLDERWQMSRSRGYQMIDAAKVSALVSTIVDTPSREAQARELAPLLREDEQQVVGAWRELREQYGDKITAVNVKRVVENRLKRIIREQEADGCRLTPPEPLVEDDIAILHGDFRDVFTEWDLDGGVIITDPPYPREFLREWEDVAETGLHWGCDALIAMCGQSILPDALNLILAARKSPDIPDEDPDWLRWHYRWCGAYLTSGPATRVWNASVGTSWKPILVFDRGGDRRFLTTDVFHSTGDDKRYHQWGQNEAGVAALVEAFTAPGDLIVDPFLGGGTTAVVSRGLGRRFIGCDIDATAIEATRRRLAA